MARGEGAHCGVVVAARRYEAHDGDWSDVGFGLGQDWYRGKKLSDKHTGAAARVTRCDFEVRLLSGAGRLAQHGVSVFPSRTEQGGEQVAADSDAVEVGACVRLHQLSAVHCRWRLVSGGERALIEGDLRRARARGGKAQPESERLRAQGNAELRAGAIDKAAACYTAAARAADAERAPHEEVAKALTNRALCYLKLQRWKEVRCE